MDSGEGKLLVVEAVPDSAAKTIHIISARRTKKGSSRVSNAKALNGTPKNVNGSASNGNVPQVKENGNSYFSGRGNGYSGYSMSNNAVDAYENGEKPISKWTKADIIGAVKEIDAEKAELLKKVNLKS